MFYKALGPGGKAIFGQGYWNLPTADAPGEWMPYIEEIEPCCSGYHVTDAAHVLDWVGPDMYIVEVEDDDMKKHTNKWVVHTARLTKKLLWDKDTAKQFLYDCWMHSDASPTWCDKQAALSVVSGDCPDDQEWNQVQELLGTCRVRSSLRASPSVEYQWQNQRLLMYLHGGVA